MGIKVQLDTSERAIIKKIDHIGIAVRSLDETLKKWETLFGVKAKHIETLKENFVRIAFVPMGGVLIELLEPSEPGAGVIGEFIEKHGEGFHHMAYRVEDLGGLLAGMKKRGIGLIDEKPRYGSRGSLIAFLGPSETNNVSIELVEMKDEFA